MILSNVKARLLVAGLAFLMITGVTLTSSAQSWVTQNVNSLGWRFEDRLLISDQEVQALNGDGQLVRTNKLSTDLSSIQLELINDTYAELSLYDLKGNRIQTIEAEPKKKGKHLVLWKHSDIPADVYLLTLYTNHGYEHLKVVLE